MDSTIVLNRTEASANKKVNLLAILYNVCLLLVAFVQYLWHNPTTKLIIKIVFFPIWGTVWFLAELCFVWTPQFIKCACELFGEDIVAAFFALVFVVLFWYGVPWAMDRW